MANKMRIPRGLYLSHRTRADFTIVYRWGMAPGLRKKGVKAIDLVDDAGRPLGLKAAIEKARALTDNMKAGQAAPAPRIATPARTVGDLVESYFEPATFNALRNGRTGELLSAATRNSYRGWRVAIDLVFRDQPIAGLDHVLIRNWFDVIRETRGHTMAYSALGLLRTICNWADKSWGVSVEWNKIRAPRPARKLRVGRPDELTCLLTAMDNPAELYQRLADEGRAVNTKHIPARPTLGDAFVIAIWTTQREKDVVAFTSDAFAGGRLRWVRTSKNNRALDMPLLGPLPARLEAAKQRKAARKATCPTVVLDPERDQPYDQRLLQDHFREARELAGQFYPSLLGKGQLGTMEAKTFTFEDCRDTGITRLHDAGCSLLQICSWSNHTSVKSLMELVDAYIEISGRTADDAGAKLQAMWDANRWAV
jgi:hypothetical protein